MSRSCRQSYKFSFSLKYQFIPVACLIILHSLLFAFTILTLFCLWKELLIEKQQIISQLSVADFFFQRDNYYGRQLSHIFDIPSISNEKPSISIEIPIISIKNLEFRSKYHVFRIRNFEILFTPWIWNTRYYFLIPSSNENNLIYLLSSEWGKIR